MTLDEVMKYYGSDKASVFTRTYAKPKDYCRHYDKLFSEARAKTIRMLEIGVGEGNPYADGLITFQMSVSLAWTS